MHIPATCPRCESVYQVEPSLRGKSMRCPNPLCRAVFEVRDPEATPPPAAPSHPAKDTAAPPPVKQFSGSVGDIVPIIQAEAVPMAMPVAEVTPAFPVVAQVPPEKPTPSKAPVQPPPPKQIEAPLPAPPPPPAWEQGPRPVRRSSPVEKPAVDPVSVTDTLEADDFLSAEPEEFTEPVQDEVLRLNAGAWEAPPVRHRGTDGYVAAPAEPTATAVLEASPPATAAPASRFRRRARWLIMVLLLGLAGGLGFGFHLARSSRASNEEERFKKAVELYEQGSFADAAAQLQALHRDFHESPHVHKYLFLKELASVRETVDSSSDPVQAWRSMREFLGTSQGDPLLKEKQFAGEIWLSLQKLAGQLVDEAEQKKDRRLITMIREVLVQASAFEAPRGSDPAASTRKTETALANLEKDIAASERRQGFLTKVKSLSQTPSAEAVREARTLIRAGGYTGDPEFQQLVQQTVAAHRAAVTYVPALDSAEQKPAAVDMQPSLAVLPLLRKAAEPKLKVHGTLFALVRGVLYALDAQSGQLRWAKRVGVDTSLLPLTLPLGPAAAPVAILTSSDHNTAWAVDEASGRTLWEQRLDGPCLAQPLLVRTTSGPPGNRLLLPGYSGRVDEIQLGDGRLLGSYQLGQPLTVGGVQHPGTGLVYFPAESYSVYVLDVVSQRCATILYSGHPRGSLRSAPIIIPEPGAGPEGRGMLMLAQEAENEEAVKLRSFSLPITSPDQPGAAPELKIPGWTWFPPYQDGERLAVATDAGMFALFGIGQKGNRDPLFSPMLRDTVTLDTSRRTRFGRSQIVHADAENFWVLTHGRLQRLELTFTRQAGPKVIQRWPEPPLLGSPLHEPQVLRDENGTTLLFLVTRVGGGQTCLASMVEAAEGRIVWQRQLGIGGHGTPVKVGEQIILDDRNGVFRFDPAGITDKSWQTAGELLTTYPAPPAARFALSTDKGDGACVLHLTGERLKVLHYQPGAEKKLIVAEHTLGRPLAGTACASHDCLILPLDSGVLARVPLGDGPVAHGPDWRASGADQGALGHVAALSGGSTFVCTDGSRGIKLIHWADATAAEVKVKKELPRRIIGPPAVLAPGSAGKDERICVADADDTLTLLDGESLATLRSWRMPGKISAGPFVRGRWLGCVVGDSRLVWLDPQKEQPVWEYTFVTAIVGEPQLIGNVVVVANVAGHIISFEPTTGRPLGPGYTLRANVAPTAAPLACAGRLFVPLTDGTVMLLNPKLLE